MLKQNVNMILPKLASLWIRLTKCIQKAVLIALTMTVVMMMEIKMLMIKMKLFCR